MGGSKHHHKLSLGIEPSSITGGEAKKVGSKQVQKTVSFFPYTSLSFGLAKPWDQHWEPVVETRELVLMGARCLITIIIMTNKKNTFELHCLKSFIC